MLGELFGIDVSSFAANLATVNLAARDLVKADNFPRVVARSFFRVDPGQPAFVLPPPLGVGGAAGAARAVEVPPLRAVVTNPPYIRGRAGCARRRRSARCWPD
ncbi:MAG: hypothetical protein ACRDZP_08030 [Acidimicrobiales bacterium]